MTFQKLVNGQWETIANASIKSSVWCGRSRFVINYLVGRTPCYAEVYGDEPNVRVLEDTAQ